MAQLAAAEGLRQPAPMTRPSLFSPSVKGHSQPLNAREEQELWKQIDPNGYMNPERLPRAHRLAIVWALYQTLRIAQEFFDHTLPDITRTTGFFMGMTTRTGINLAIKAGMHALASEKDEFLAHTVRLFFANLPPDISAQADGVVRFVRAEARQLQSTSNVQARLRAVVEKLKALFYTLDPHANRGRPIPYEMPREVYALLAAVQKHHRALLLQRVSQRITR